MPRRECSRDLTDYDWAILGTLDPWERDYLNCASTSDPDIGSISC
jgi:hypothetical protein